MAKNSGSTFIEWGGIIFALLFVVPRLLSAMSTNNSRLAGSTIPSIAAQQQAARAINTAGYAGNSALSGLLSRLLAPSNQQQSKGSSSGGSSGGNNSGGGGGGFGARPESLSWFTPFADNIHQVGSDPRPWDNIPQSPAPTVNYGPGDYSFLNTGLPSAEGVVQGAPDPWDSTSDLSNYGDPFGDLWSMVTFDPGQPDVSAIPLSAYNNPYDDLSSQVSYYGDGGSSDYYGYSDGSYGDAYAYTDEFAAYDDGLSYGWGDR